MPYYINTRTLLSQKTGVQRYLSSILPYLDSEKFQLIGPNPKSRIGGYFWEQLTLPKLIGKSLLWSPANMGPIKHRNHIVTLHDISVIDHPEWFDKKFAYLYSLLLPKLTRNAKTIITSSQFSKERISTVFRIKIEKIQVVHCGLEDKFFNSERENIGAANFMSKFPQDYILYVGSMDPRKNILRLLQAWEKLSLNTDIKLCVVGANQHSLARLKFNSIPKNVIFTGYVDDQELLFLYRNAHCFIYPSLYEGFGLPPLEAMSQKCPVITSDIRPIRDIIGNEAAIFVDPLNVADIVEKIESVILDDSLRTRLSRKGFEVASKFRAKKTAKEIEEILTTSI
ncbi:MAG: glycosyltransferase family 1 protein [Balneola sp.]|nr:MAG: glycosyltransferase family 1 protein [Balneola sp.]